MCVIKESRVCAGRTIHLNERQRDDIIRGAAATLAWTPWRHDDRFDDAARWRDLPTSARYFQGGSRGCRATGLLSRRRDRRRVRAEPRVGSVVLDVVVLSSLPRRRDAKFCSGFADSFSPGLILGEALSHGINFSPVSGVTVSWVVRVEDTEGCPKSAGRSAAAQTER